MLTNKKFVRLAALVMALLMTVAVFAGCSNKQQIADMQAQIDASNQAAKDAQAAADQAAKDAQAKAEALEKLLEDLKKGQEDGFAGVQEGIDKVDDKVDKYHPEGSEDDSMNKGEFEGITEEILKNEKLKSYTELYTMYITDRADWYTSENYGKLVKIFEEAALELYRATTVDGIDQIIAEASAAAAAVDSIVSDAAKVQALIDAFGDVETEIFTTNEDKVFAARDAFDAWVDKYEIRFFTKNGYDFIYDKGDIVTAGAMIAAVDSISGKEVPVAKDIVDFAKKLTNNLVYININDNTNSLLFAEKKIEALHALALQAIKNEMIAELVINKYEEGDKAKAEALVNELFLSVADKEITQVRMTEVIKEYEKVLTQIKRYGVNYADCAAPANAALIEAAYTEYRVFWNANGGDDSAITGAPSAQLLTGTEFVKRYVQTLYDGQLREYQNTVNTYLSEYVINFFMNNGDATSTIPTAWAELLNFYGDYDVKYANDGAAYVDAKTVITFAVADDGITIYTNGTKGDTIKADGVAIEHAFNVVAAKAYASIFDLVYSEDFKGNKSLDEAYVAIDQIVVKAVSEMTQVYYDEVIVPVLVEQLTAADEAEYNTFVTNTTETLTYYKDADKAFYNNLTKLYDDAKAAVKAVKVPTYDELNTIEDSEEDIKNIEDQAMFTVKKNGVVFNGVELNTGKNAAMETVLTYFSEAMGKAADVYFAKKENIKDDKDFYVLKKDYAKQIDVIFGDGAKFNSDDAKTEGEIGKLGADFYEAAQKVSGKTDGKYNLKQAAIFKAVDTPAKAARNAIMALQFMDYTTCEAKYSIEKYQAQETEDSDKLYYTLSSGAVSTTSKDNKALEIIVDREVVAENAIIDTFANGADATLKAFADLIRSYIKTAVADGIDLYKTNYSFGDKDPVGVYLEKDMNEYVAYLDSLTNLAAVEDFTAVKFTTAYEKLDISNTTLNVDTGITGYETQVVYKADGTTKDAYLLHVKFDTNDTAEAITGTKKSTAGAWYDTLAKADLTNYIAMADGRAYKGLEDVRKLAYLKDDLINGIVAVTITDSYDDDGVSTTADKTYTKTFAKSLKTIMAGFTGYVDKDGVLQGVDSAYTYQLGTARTELYLIRLNEAYDRIVAKLDAVTLLSGDNKDVDSWKALQNAVDDIEKIVTQATNKTAQLKASTDDYSLAIAYNRYYLEEYDWSAYKANK